MGDSTGRSQTLPADHPDLIIGIDFGMTYTGVAWTTLSHIAHQTQSINNWPGLGESTETKVPSKLIYNANGDVKWGFLCNDETSNHGDETFEWFKIYLDQRSIDGALRSGIQDCPKTVAHTKCLIKDYLRHVYFQIKESIQDSTGSWGFSKIEFHFSTPTTWVSQDIMSDFKEAIEAAGFGRENPEKHTATLELTEAEASAVYVANVRQVQFGTGDIILICDAGGGTTDLGLLKVTNAELPALAGLNPVSGVGIGSTVIDRMFQQLVQTRLNNHPDAKASLPSRLAHRMAHSTTFRAIKHNFGTSAGNQEEYYFKLDVLGMNISQDYFHPGIRVEGGRMIFARSGEFVRYLVLSGGLGGSAYVKGQLEQQYGSSWMSIIRTQEPRLSVAKGLVLDRKQKLLTGSATLKSRVARASYGVLCRQPYDPQLHVGAVVEMDIFKKNQRWAINQIDWLIRKGETIETDSAKERLFTKKLMPGDPNRLWDMEIIISYNDPTSLPRSLKQEGAKKLCLVQSDMSQVADSEFQVKNKRCWEGKRYLLATFTVRVVIAPADLKFELWFKGAKYNRGHDPIKIEWDAAGASMRPPTHGEVNATFEAPRFR